MESLGVPLSYTTNFAAHRVRHRRHGPRWVPRVSDDVGDRVLDGCVRRRPLRLAEPVDVQLESVVHAWPLSIGRANARRQVQVVQEVHCTTCPCPGARRSRP